MAKKQTDRFELLLVLSPTTQRQETPTTAAVYARAFRVAALLGRDEVVNETASPNYGYDVFVQIKFFVNRNYI